MDDECARLSTNFFYSNSQFKLLFGSLWNKFELSGAQKLFIGKKWNQFSVEWIFLLSLSRLFLTHSTYLWAQYKCEWVIFFAETENIIHKRFVAVFLLMLRQFWENSKLVKPHSLGVVGKERDQESNFVILWPARQQRSTTANKNSTQNGEWKSKH